MIDSVLLLFHLVQFFLEFLPKDSSWAETFNLQTIIILKPPDPLWDSQSDHFNIGSE